MLNFYHSFNTYCFEQVDHSLVISISCHSFKQVDRSQVISFSFTKYFGRKDALHHD